MKQTLLSGAASLLGTLPLWIGTSASAALTISESFDYPSNLGASINNRSGGTGFSGSWTNLAEDSTLSAANTSLAYPSSSPLVSQGAHLALTAADASISSSRNLTATMNLGTSGLVFYSSSLVSLSTIGQTVAVQFADSSNAVRWNYGINASGNFFAGVASGTNQTVAGNIVLTPGTTYLMVARIKTNSGPSGVDEVAFSFFDLSAPIAEPATDAGWHINASGGSGVNLSRINLIFNNAAGTALRFDELKVGTTFQDVTGVIPEPSSAALFILGSAFVSRRKRR